MSTQQTYTLALIVTDITNPFFTTLARGVEDAASAAGCMVIFCNTDESEEKESRYLQMLLQKQVDGFLVVPAQSQPDTVRKIQQNGYPVVVLDRRVPGVDVDMVRTDAEEGAYRLTQLLLDLGHRQIAMISGPKDVSTAADRASGFLRAMAEAGMPVEENYVQHGKFTPESGYEMTLRLVQLPLRPTALFAANNFLTVGAMKALQEVGLEVPEDIALVGFDDLPPSLVSFPFFTVASQPAYEMGRRATDLLLKRLREGPGSAAAEEVMLPVRIITRRSSGEILG